MVQKNEGGGNFAGRGAMPGPSASQVFYVPDFMSDMACSKKNSSFFLIS